MGCSSPQNATMPNIPATHLSRLLQVSDINHQLNVNKKYQHLTRIREGISTGQGFKRTFAYDCLTTPDQLKAKRREFWETRVNGSPQCWNAIRMAVEQNDQSTGLAILQSVRVSMLNNNIQMCVDPRFNKYEVPVFCLNEPASYSQETIAEKNLNMQYSEAPVQLKVRTVLFPTEDIMLAVNASTDVDIAKALLLSQKGLDPQRIVRFFYNGREMTGSHTVGNYNYVEGSVVQAMIK